MLVRAFLFLSTLAIVMVYPLGSCLAKPQPPSELQGVIAEFAELEESFEGGEWDEALKTLNEVEKELNELSEEVPSKLKRDFGPRIKILRRHINSKNEGKTEKAYIKLQKDIFDYADKFNYKVHPILAIIKKYIDDEASEALEKGDFDDVVSEMREVSNLLFTAKEVLIAKGVSESEVIGFRKTVRDVIKAAKKKDSASSRKKIDKASHQFATFLSR